MSNYTHSNTKTAQPLINTNRFKVESQMTLGTQSLGSQNEPIISFLSPKSKQVPNEVTYSRFSLNNVQRQENIKKMKTQSRAIQDQIKEARLEQKEHLYDFEVVSFLKKYYDMSFQQSTNVIKQLKSELKLDQAHIAKDSLISYLQNKSIYDRDALRTSCSETSLAIQSNSRGRSGLGIGSNQNSNSKITNLKQNLLITNKQSQGIHDVSERHQMSVQSNTSSQKKPQQPLFNSKIISTQFLRQQDQLNYPQREGIHFNLSSQNQLLSPKTQTHQDAKTLFSPQTSIRNSVQKLNIALSNKQSPKSNCSKQNYLQQSHSSNKLFSPSNISNNRKLVAEQVKVAQIQHQQQINTPKSHNNYAKYLNIKQQTSGEIKSQQIQRNTYLKSSKVMQSKLIEFKDNNLFNKPQQQNQSPKQTQKDQMQETLKSNDVHFQSRNQQIQSSFTSPQAKVGQGPYSLKSMREQDFTKQQFSSDDYIQSSHEAFPKYKTYHQEQLSDDQSDCVRKLSFSHQSQVQLLSDGKQRNTETCLNQEENMQQKQSQHINDMQLKNDSKEQRQYKSVVFQSNIKSRSNSFIRGSPTKFLGNKDKVISERYYLNPGEDQRIDGKDYIVDKFKDIMEELKQHCKDINIQFDKRHSELFQQDVGSQEHNLYDSQNEQEHQQNEEQLSQSRNQRSSDKMRLLDNHYAQALTQAKYGKSENLDKSGHHNFGTQQILLNKSINKSMNADNDQSQRQIEYIDHFNKTYTGLISPIEQSRILNDQYQLTQQSPVGNSRIRQRIREIQDEFDERRGANQTLQNSYINETQITSKNSPQKQQDQMICDQEEKSNPLKIESPQFISVIQENAKEDESTLGISQTIQAKNQEVVSTKKQFLNDKLKKIKARLLNIDSQVSSPKTLISSPSKEFIFVQNQEENPEKEEDEHEVHRTFAMDINESFGTVGNTTSRKRGSQFRSQEADYDSGYYKTYRRDTDQNDPSEILKSLKEATYKHLTESRLRNDIEENRSQKKLSPQKKSAFYFNNLDKDNDQSDQYIKSQDYIEQQKKKNQKVQEEYEKTQKMIQDFQNDDLQE